MTTLYRLFFTSLKTQICIPYMWFSSYQNCTLTSTIFIKIKLDSKHSWRTKVKDKGKIKYNLCSVYIPLYLNSAIFPRRPDISVILYQLFYVMQGGKCKWKNTLLKQIAEIIFFCIVIWGKISTNGCIYLIKHLIYRSTVHIPTVQDFKIWDPSEGDFLEQHGRVFSYLIFIDRISPHKIKYVLKFVSLFKMKWVIILSEDIASFSSVQNTFQIY